MSRAMLMFVLGMAALLVGPILVSVLLRWPSVTSALDGFVLVVVGGLVLLHILPQSYAVAGLPVMAAAVAGLFVPRLLEPRHHHQHRHSISVLALAMLGLAAHATMDGAALGLGEHSDHGHLLGLGVILHRIPMGVAIWWATRPVYGLGWAGAFLACNAAATAIGFWLSQVGIPSQEAAGLAWFQAFVAGSLLHVVWHPPLKVAQRPRARMMSGLAGLLGFGLIYALSAAHPTHPTGGELSAAHTFFTLALETAPALLLAFAGAGLLIAFVRPASLGFLKDPSKFGQGLRGMAFGLPLPLCSCGVIPVYKGLVRAGVPLTAGLAFLIATPELGVDAVLVSLPLLGLEITLWRVAAAAVVALATAIFVGALARTARVPAASDSDPPPATRRERVRMGLRYGFVELFDSTAPWMVAGLLLAAFIEPLFQSEWVAHLPSGLDVPLLAILGIPAYICASGATPLGAVLLHKGVSAGAVVAMLLTGPATNITTFGILARLHGKRVAFSFAIIVTALSCLAGLMINMLQPDLSGILLHEHADHGPTILSSLALGVLVLLLLTSLLRQGMRGMLAQVITPFSAHGGEHAGHSHDHSHPGDSHACESPACGHA